MRTPTDTNYDKDGFMIPEPDCRFCKGCGCLKDKEDFYDYDKRMCKKYKGGK